METNRFVKVTLVVIALLLAIICAKNFIASSVEAAPPPTFIQTGKSYYGGTGTLNTFKVLEVQSNGWIKAEGQALNGPKVIWVNTSALTYMQLADQQ
ncbi:MAG: hypothetical protein QOC96_1160 [Acidobacteriota bacterium]|jgi:hypothetical protein|nr:hypothetical protein [Acidobacteriota bacterium]